MQTDENLEMIFSLHSEVKDIYKMINDINDKLHVDLKYHVEMPEDKIIHVLSTKKRRYEFNSRTEACDFLLTNYGKS